MSHPTYTEAWREANRAAAQSSAAVLASLIRQHFAPRTVLDVGCGEGWLGRALALRDITTIGVDGHWVDPDIVVDLEHPPYPFGVPACDVAVCLEVAEHLPAERAEYLVEWLCEKAPVVVFSAAIPGQGGEGHVNEQWPGYWVDLFAEQGYPGSGALRWTIWDDDAVGPWYRQNLLVFGAHDLPLDGCPAVVHPAMWAWKGHA